jgi:hypothetical protein
VQNSSFLVRKDDNENDNHSCKNPEDEEMAFVRDSDQNKTMKKNSIERISSKNRGIFSDIRSDSMVFQSSPLGSPSVTENKKACHGCCCVLF